MIDLPFLSDESIRNTSVLNENLKEIRTTLDSIISIYFHFVAGSDHQSLTFTLILVIRVMKDTSKYTTPNGKNIRKKY